MRGWLGLLLLLVVSPIPAADSSTPPDLWAAVMRRFDAIDKETPTSPGGVVFVGSSSIRLWDLGNSFPEVAALNRGFGGSELADSVRHVERLVTRHQPSTVVLYAGDNDIAHSKTPEEVIKDFKQFVTVVREKLPETKIVYIAIKPSLARWNLAEPMQKSNAGIKEVCEEIENCEFVDVWPAMLDEAGRPRSELFVEDGLHMSPAGYEIWTKLVAPHLE